MLSKIDEYDSDLLQNQKVERHIEHHIHVDFLAGNNPGHCHLMFRISPDGCSGQHSRGHCLIFC